MVLKTSIVEKKPKTCLTHFLKLIFVSNLKVYKQKNYKSIKAFQKKYKNTYIKYKQTYF